MKSFLDKTQMFVLMHGLSASAQSYACTHIFQAIFSYPRPAQAVIVGCPQPLLSSRISDMGNRDPEIVKDGRIDSR